MRAIARDNEGQKEKEKKTEVTVFLRLCRVFSDSCRFSRFSGLAAIPVVSSKINSSGSLFPHVRSHTEHTAPSCTPLKSFLPLLLLLLSLLRGFGYGALDVIDRPKIMSFQATSGPSRGCKGLRRSAWHIHGVRVWLWRHSSVLARVRKFLPTSRRPAAAGCRCIHRDAKRREQPPLYIVVSISLFLPPSISLSLLFSYFIMLQSFSHYF